MKRTGGFTLLEVLVALIIAALGLGALFSGISGGLHAVQAADLTDQALSRARSRLDSLAGTAPSPGRQSGDDGGGFRWQTEVSGAGFATTSAQDPTQMALYDVAVMITWDTEGQTKRVEIASQVLAIISAAPP